MKSFHVVTLIFLSTFFSIQTSEGIHICGAYCGPDWCGSRIAEECGDCSAGSSCHKKSTDCQESSPNDGSCADSCCQSHDACCGSTDRRPCNNNIIQCLKNCKSQYPNASQCRHNNLDVPVEVILVAMELDPYGCCGTSCRETTTVANSTAPETVANSTAPEHFLLDFATDIDGVGVITLNITRAWSPTGVDHLFKLVNDGFYDASAFTRVDGGFVLQFGISGTPANNVKYNQSIKDDPVVQPNVQFTMSYATSEKNSRTTQLFINYQDNTELDGQGFSPVGIVVKGNEYLSRVHDPTPGDTNGVNQQEYATKGNAWIRQKYPEINFIKKATIRAGR